MFLSANWHEIQKNVNVRDGGTTDVNKSCMNEKSQEPLSACVKGKTELNYMLSSTSFPILGLDVELGRAKYCRGMSPNSFHKYNILYIPYVHIFL